MSRPGLNLHGAANLFSEIKAEPKIEESKVEDREALQKSQMNERPKQEEIKSEDNAVLQNSTTNASNVHSSKDQDAQRGTQCTSEVGNSRDDPTEIALGSRKSGSRLPNKDYIKERKRKRSEYHSEYSIENKDPNGEAEESELDKGDRESVDKLSFYKDKTNNQNEEKAMEKEDEGVNVDTGESREESRKERGNKINADGLKQLSDQLANVLSSLRSKQNRTIDSQVAQLEGVMSNMITNSIAAATEMESIHDKSVETAQLASAVARQDEKISSLVDNVSKIKAILNDIEKRARDMRTEVGDTTDKTRIVSSDLREAAGNLKLLNQYQMDQLEEIQKVVDAIKQAKNE